jgi:hypothetical protein
MGAQQQALVLGGTFPPGKHVDRGPSGVGSSIPMPSNTSTSQPDCSSAWAQEVNSLMFPQAFGGNPQQLLQKVL